jgi:hypothetical protein
VETTPAADASPVVDPLPPLPPGPGVASVPEAAGADAGAGNATAAAPRRVLLVDEPPFRAVYAHVVAPVSQAHAKKHGRHGRPFHAAPRVVVDVPDADRDPAAAALQRAARNLAYWPFRTCFEEGLRRSPDLGGKVHLDLRATGGELTAADVGPSTLEDPIVAACVAREAALLHLPGVGDGAATIDVTLGAGDDPVFAPPPVRNASSLRQALRAPWDAVQRCFAEGLASDPAAGGRMQLRFRVEPTGAVAEVSEIDTRFRAIDVTRCVLGVYRTVNLPPRVGSSGDETFVYALHFESGAQAAP